jgi:hypothetical protein
MPYSLICDYFILDLEVYGHLEFKVRCVGLYVLDYYYKLVIAYHEYTSQWQTIKLKGPTFVMEYSTRQTKIFINYAKEQVD